MCGQEAREVFEYFLLVEEVEQKSVQRGKCLPFFGRVVDEVFVVAQVSLVVELQDFALQKFLQVELSQKPQSFSYKGGGEAEVLQGKRFLLVEGIDSSDSVLPQGQYHSLQYLHVGEEGLFVAQHEGVAEVD